jgi:hypothetical protein
MLFGVATRQPFGTVTDCQKITLSTRAASLVTTSIPFALSATLMPRAFITANQWIRWIQRKVEW